MCSLDLQRFAADASTSSGHSRRKRAGATARATAVVYPLRRARAKAGTRKSGSRPRTVSGRAATVPPSVFTPPERTAKYVVQTGDTLHRISSRFGTSARLLAALNGLHKPALLVPGEVILVPDSPHSG